jgi:hypothetical protein
MEHIFRVGDLVRTTHRLGDFPGRGIYRVTHLLPTDPEGVPLYRVRNVSVAVDWVVGQNNIEKA